MLTINDNTVNYNFQSKNISSQLPDDIRTKKYLDKWNHIALACRNNQMKVYVNQFRVLVLPGLDFVPVSLKIGGIGSQKSPILCTNVKIAEPTVKVIAEKWYVGHVLVKNKPMTQTWQRWALDKYVLPQLGELKITELTRPKAFAFLDGLGHTPVTANRVKALVSKMWSWSEARDETEGHPMASMPNPTRGWERHAETPRERRLSVEEIVALGKAYQKAPSALNSAAIFILLTGCREGAVVALEPGTKLDDGLLRFAPGLPGLKGCRRVYVPEVAAALLTKIEAPVLKRSLWRSWSILRKSAGLGDVSIHDLRRTFASVAVDQGHDGEVIDVLQSHSVGRIRDTYQVRSDPALAKVAAEVSAYIAVLLGIHVSKPKPIPTKTSKGVAVKEPSIGSKAARNQTAEPSVRVKEARMPKKGTKAATPAGKAKSSQPRQRLRSRLQ